MRLFFDTSCLVAVMHERHPAFDAVWRSYELAGRRGAEAWTSSHALAELFAVLTALPVKPRPSPRIVTALVERHLSERLRVQAVGTPDVRWAMRRLAERALGGGRIYDALHVRAALRCRADSILSLNPRHFRGIDATADGLVRDASTPSP